MSSSDKIVVRSEPKQVYRALLHPESLSQWWGCTAVIDAQAGGAWVGGWGEGADGLGQQTVIWAITGMWKFQHEPRLLDNGNILLFDNMGNAGMSRIVEFDPLTQKVVWTYKGDSERIF